MRQWWEQAPSTRCVHHGRRPSANQEQHLHPKYRSNRETQKSVRQGATSNQQQNGQTSTKKHKQQRHKSPHTHRERQATFTRCDHADDWPSLQSRSRHRASVSLHPSSSARAAESEAEAQVEWGARESTRGRTREEGPNPRRRKWIEHEAEWKADNSKERREESRQQSRACDDQNACWCGQIAPANQRINDRVETWWESRKRKNEQQEKERKQKEKIREAEGQKKKKGVVPVLLPRAMVAAGRCV